MRAEELIGRRDIVVKALVAKDLDEAIVHCNHQNLGLTLRELPRHIKKKEISRSLMSI